ncbi:purine-binding chemotaxis protein CheW [bacterium]|nr:purine-binding chemotaxis protein CheW [bacterium]
MKSTNTIVTDTTEGVISSKYLTFRIGAEAYGLDIQRVQEIIGLLPITRVPRLPAAIRGVVNLRGKVIPVVDLRVRFDSEPVDTEITCVIVAQIDDGSRSLVLGIIVDSVSEVVDIPSAAVTDVPEFGADVETAFLTGVATVEDDVILLLDVDRVLDGNVMEQLEVADEEG